jgi:hypothetical protein
MDTLSYRNSDIERSHPAKKSDPIKCDLFNCVLVPQKSVVYFFAQASPHSARVRQNFLMIDVAGNHDKNDPLSNEAAVKSELRVVLRKRRKWRVVIKFFTVQSLAIIFGLALAQK